jgi:hypothetical protein
VVSFEPTTGLIGAHTTRHPSEHTRILAPATRVCRARTQASARRGHCPRQKVPRPLERDPHARDPASHGPLGVWSRHRLSTVQGAARPLWPPALRSSLTARMCEQALYATGRWETLTTRFRATVFNLHSLLPLPPLSLSLYTGLASLKTQACYSDSPHEHNDDCPLCDKQGLGALARGKPVDGGVPWSHHVNSNIVCKITGRVMEGEDGPMVLPNGRVYSRSVRYIFPFFHTLLF